MSSKLRRDLCASTFDGAAFSVMVGAGETYVPALALAVGVGEVAAGWIVSLPLMAGAVLQLVSPRAVHFFGGHKRWVLFCAGAQAVSVALYAVAALRGEVPAAALFVIATLYWASGLATGPAWNAWIGALVPARLRATFFGQRSRLAQIGVLVGLVGAGLTLQGGVRDGRLLEAFAAIFAAAALCRVISVSLLVVQSPAATLRPTRDGPSPFGWLRGAGHRSDRRLLIYMLAVQTALQVSGPFFTPYMLAQLHFSYAEYLGLLSTSFATKALILPLLGRVAGRIGSQRLLYVAGFGIVPLTLLWTVSDSYAWLMGIQVLSGSIWATYELCTFLLLFEHIPEAERTSVLTGFNVANAVAMVAGSLAGGTLLHLVGPSRAGYYTLFVLSSALRVVSLVFLARLTRVTFLPGFLAIRSVAVRPNAGSIDAPIVVSMAEEGTEEARE